MKTTIKNNGFFRYALLAAVCAAPLLPAGVAVAQFAPSPADPGVIMRGLEDDRRTVAPRDDIVTVPRYEDPSVELSAEKVFVLRGVVLEGGSVYGDADLSALYRDFAGQEVSFADLYTITQRVTRKYREDGYIFSRAILPPQKISEGIVRLQAAEGRITNVEVTGDFKDAGGLIAGFADKIRTEGPANTKDIERYLLLIDDLPGIRARSIVRPAAEQGGGDLIITIEQDFFEGSVGIDNRGSRYLGPYRGTVVGAFNSLLSRHDRTTLRAIAAHQVKELVFAEVMHEQQIGTEGTRVKARAGVTRSEPGGNVTALGIEGDSEVLDLEVMHPLWRSRRHNVNLYAGINALHAETDILTGAVRTNDRVRTLRWGAQYDFTDRWGINQVGVIMTQGLDSLGASRNGAGRSRVNGKHEFLRTNIDASRLQELYGNFSLLVAGSAQLADNPLLASEEFSVGGPNFGRAYDSGEINGDEGWAGLAEIRYSAGVENGFIRNYQLYGFLDYGSVRNHTPTVGEAGESSVTSSGVGLRFNLQHDISGSFEATNPMTRNVASESDNGTRFFFSLLKRL